MGSAGGETGCSISFTAASAEELSASMLPQAQNDKMRESAMIRDNAFFMETILSVYTKPGKT
jgi:hypothetical protein